MASQPSMDELDRLVAELRRIDTMRRRVAPGDPALAELEDAEAEARARLREVTRALELRRTRLELETELASLEDEYRSVVGDGPGPGERPGADPAAGRDPARAVRAVESPHSAATLKERIKRVRLRLARLPGADHGRP